MATNDIQGLGEQLISLTVKEVQELAAYLKEVHGLEQSGVVTVERFVMPGDGYTPAIEKTNFDVILLSHGVNKLKVVVTVKDVMNIGLKEAKELVEKVPIKLNEGLPKDSAQFIKYKLEMEGATVELR